MDAPYSMQSKQPEGLKKPKGAAARKILSTGGLLVAVLLSLLLGLAVVISSLKNVRLTLHLKLKGNEHAGKK